MYINTRPGQGMALALMKYFEKEFPKLKGALSSEWFDGDLLLISYTHFTPESYEEFAPKGRFDDGDIILRLTREKNNDVVISFHGAARNGKNIVVPIEDLLSLLPIESKVKSEMEKIFDKAVGPNLKKFMAGIKANNAKIEDDYRNKERLRSFSPTKSSINESDNFEDDDDDDDSQETIARLPQRRMRHSGPMY